MQIIFVKEWDGCSQDLFYCDVYQVLIMVLLVEKEIGVLEECLQIVGVFVCCLQCGMLLQIDLMVIYGMGECYNGKIICVDLCELIFYNIYVVLGMLLILIVLVGCEVICVVLYLVEGEILYFVVCGDGSYVFFSSLDEYNKVVCEYQLKCCLDYCFSFVFIILLL